MPTNRVKWSMVLPGLSLVVASQLRAQFDTTAEAAVLQAAVRFIDAFNNLGDAAIVTFHLGERPRLGRRTLVFVRRGDRWLIAHLHGSSSLPPADTTR